MITRKKRAVPALGRLTVPGVDEQAREIVAGLRRDGPAIPRTTLRYAIERFPAGDRRGLLESTRPAAPTR
jgi:hypothetical protein